MANTENKATKAAEAVKEVKKVELFVPRGSINEDPNEIIGLNGVLYILPKGKKSLVPEAVANEYYRAQEAKARYDEGITQRMEAAN